MKDFDHEHILRLVGIVVEEDRTCIVLPYMDYGDVRSFISTETNVNSPLSY